MRGVSEDKSRVQLKLLCPGLARLRPTGTKVRSKNVAGKLPSLRSRVTVMCFVPSGSLLHLSALRDHMEALQSTQPFSSLHPFQCWKNYLQVATLYIHNWTQRLLVFTLTFVLQLLLWA